MRLRQLLWDEWNEAHVARHRVTPAEVEEVVFGERTRFFEAPDGRRVLAFGPTARGRHLLVVTDAPSRGGSAYVVTARPMTTRELRAFEEEHE